jgi:hypothetical protein
VSKYDKPPGGRPGGSSGLVTVLARNGSTIAIDDTTAVPTGSRQTAVDKHYTPGVKACLVHLLRHLFEFSPALAAGPGGVCWPAGLGSGRHEHGSLA